jgi:hypothetical protein
MPYAASKKRSRLIAIQVERYDGMSHYNNKEIRNARTTTHHNRKPNRLRQQAPQQHGFQ